MQDTERLLASVENYLAQQELPSEPEKLYAPIGYSLSGGGKRLRPMLLMLTCGIFSDRPERAMPAAAAVEVFHNFTLLHDDIMDNAAMRRGKPSVAARWGRNVAILSGDAMLIWAYRLLGQVEPALLPRILAEFNEMAIGVCEGQQYDMDYEERQKVSVVEYMRMIELKTSVLLGCACRIGAIMAGATEEVCDKFYNYGISLGLAFQLQDDWLDTFGDPVVFGKEIGGDIVNKKKTWLLITSLAEAEEEVEGILGEDLEPEERVAQVKRVYDRLKLSERCAAVALRYAGEAIAALQGVTLDRDAENFFVDLARKAATRNH